MNAPVEFFGTKQKRSLSYRLKLYTKIALASWQRYKRQIIVFSVLAVVALFSLIRFFQVSFVEHAYTFREGMVGQYTKANLPEVAEQAISMGLTKITENGQATASAAKRWEVSDDRLTYTFYLREDLSWHDGSPFVAQDLAHLFEGIDAKATADHVIQFHLKNPYTPFPTILAKPLIKGEGDQLLGLGRYKVSRIETAGNYVSLIDVVDRDNSKNKLSFRFYSSNADLIAAYKLGEVTAITGTFNQTELITWPNIAYYKSPTYKSHVVLLYNTTDKLLADKIVRQALTYAIPKDKFPGEPAISPIPPVSWAYNPNVKQYVYDTNHAKELFTKRGGLPQDSITITTTLPFVAQADQIKTAWEKIGLRVKVITVPEITKDFQVALIRQEIPADPDQYTMWHRLQKQTNLTGYADDRVDKLLEDARALDDMQERKKKYLDFQRFLVEDAPAAFLYYPYENLLLRKTFDSPFYRQINGFD